jgi:hypothetical protein
MRIYDVIFYFNEKEILESRVEFLSSFVDEVIVFNFGFDNLDTTDCITFNVDKSYSDFVKDDLKKIIQEHLQNKIVSFEDIFIFSKTFEIPKTDSILYYKENIYSGPKFLNHNVYVHSPKTRSLYKEIGSCFMRWGDILVSNVYPLIHSKKLYDFEKYDLLDGGLTFYNFMNVDKSLSSLKFWYGDIFLKVLTEDIIDMENKNIFLFGHNKKNILIEDPCSECEMFTKKFENIQPKNVLIRFDEPKKIKGNFFKQVYITYDEIYDSEIDIHRVIKPSSQFYESERFTEDYLKNDILSFLNTLSLRNFDEIYIKTKTEDKPSVFTYEFMKNSIPSDIT